MNRRRRARATPEIATGSNIPIGGRLEPLSPAEAANIVDAAFTIVGDIGMAGVPVAVASQLRANGAALRHDGRLCFPRSMVEDALARLS